MDLTTHHCCSPNSSTSPKSPGNCAEAESVPINDNELLINNSSAIFFQSSWVETRSPLLHPSANVHIMYAHKSETLWKCHVFNKLLLFLADCSPRTETLLSFAFKKLFIHQITDPNLTNKGSQSSLNFKCYLKKSLLFVNICMHFPCALLSGPTFMEM